MGSNGKVRNQGKIQRVLRELVSTLVEEVGPDETAGMLEMAAAKLRGAGRSHKQTTAHEDRTTTVRPRVVANR
jgi:hypothetical protein